MFSCLSAGIVEHGGSVVYGAHVRHILTEDREGGREAVGVKLADGREFRAKVGTQGSKTNLVTILNRFIGKKHY